MARTTVLTPSLVSSSSTSLAIVVLPEPGRPVSHKQKFIVFETVETVETVEVHEICRRIFHKTPLPSGL
jgi:hypothetical protein